MIVALETLPKAVTRHRHRRVSYVGSPANRRPFGEINRTQPLVRFQLPAPAPIADTAWKAKPKEQPNANFIPI